MTLAEAHLNEAAVPATPVWLDNFVCQYQMLDSTGCPEIIHNVNRSSRWNQSLTVGGVNTYSRDSDQIYYRGEAPPVDHEPVLAFAQDCLNHYTTERKHAGDVPLFAMPEGYSILRYRPGQAYHAVHSDAAWPDLTHRHVTFIMFLNTVSAGGELEFPQQDLKVKPVEGRAVIFPAVWTHAHRSLPCNVERYVFNIFFGFVKET